MGSPYTTSDVYDPVYDDGGAVFNALNPRFSATFDGSGNVTNGSDVLAAALADAAAAQKPATVYVPGGRSWHIDETVVTRKEVLLRLDPGATLEAVENVDVLELVGGAQVSGGIIDVTLSGFTKAAIHVSGSPAVAVSTPVTTVSDMTITGAGQAGYGIHMNPSVAYAVVTSVRVNNVAFDTLHTGVRLEPASPDGTTVVYVNGNLFDQLSFWKCGRAIETVGLGASPESVAGNQFSSLFIQPATSSSVSVAGIICRGRDNLFSGYIVDASSFTDIGVRLTESSKSNILVLPGIVGTYVENLGERNVVTLSSNEKFPQLMVLAPGNQAVRAFGGSQDDYLAYADRRYTVTQTAGPAPTSTASDLSRLFDPLEKMLYVEWVAPTSQVSLEIDFGGEINYLVTTGIIFRKSATDMPTGVSVWGLTPSDVWEPLFATSSNQSRLVSVMHPTGLTKLKKLRIDLADTSATIWLQKIFGFSGSEGGHAWLPRGGGSAYGAMDLEGGVSVGGGARLAGLLGGTTAWTTAPSSLAAGGVAHADVTVPGATTGAPALATFQPTGATDLVIAAHVASADTVRVTMYNPTASSIPLGNGTVRTWVFEP